MVYAEYINYFQVLMFVSVAVLEWILRIFDEVVK